MLYYSFMKYLTIKGNNKFINKVLVFDLFQYVEHLEKISRV